MNYELWVKGISAKERMLKIPGRLVPHGLRHLFTRIGAVPRQISRAGIIDET